MSGVAIGTGGRSGAVAGNVGRKGEGEIAKFDLAGDRSIRRNGGAPIVDLRLRAEDVIEATHGGGAALKNVGDPTESNHRPDQQTEKTVESNEGAKRNLAAQQFVAALPEDDQERNTDERLERRHEHAPSA